MVRLPAPAKKLKPGAAEVPIPPAVLTGDGELTCNISDKENGHQKLSISHGGGLEFDAVVSPIVDGRVATAGPEKGGSYKFTSHLAKPATGTLPGVGKIDLDELETKVVVEMTRYQQPKGKGTQLSFTSRDMSAARHLRRVLGARPRGERREVLVSRQPGRADRRARPHRPGRRQRRFAHGVEDGLVRAPLTTVLVTTTVNRTQ